MTLAPILLSSPVSLGAVPARVADDLIRWAAEAPQRTFLAERDGNAWRAIGYAAALDAVRRTGGGILAAGGDGDHPVAILADNSIAHALVANAAMYVGVPVAPLSVAYARGDAPPARLRAFLDILTPSVVFAGDDNVAARIRNTGFDGRVVMSTDALQGDPASADAALRRVGPGTPAKILFTSGSTGVPKGVITTNRMLAANQTMYGQCWPASAKDPVFVDWLPWSHCFGGSFVFGLALRNGGTLYLDGGKPAPGAFDATLQNLREIAPTSYFNVPRGFALLLDALESDAALATTFFSRLCLLLNAGAALPSSLRARLSALMERFAMRDARIISCWGATETAPLATGSWGDPPPERDTIGTPVPGVEIKLAPVGDRYEIRVRGSNVTPGYWRNPDATSGAFDDEGFYCTGDAGALRDATNESAGIDFCGRIAENFKLSSGTWVNVGNVRLALLDALPLLEDAVIAGHDGEAVVALFFLARDAARAFCGETEAGLTELAVHPAVREHFLTALSAYNAKHAQSSMRIARAIVLGEAPDRAGGEITDKGSINQSRSLALRAGAIARLSSGTPDAQMLLFCLPS